MPGVGVGGVDDAPPTTPNARNSQPIGFSGGAAAISAPTSDERRSRSASSRGLRQDRGRARVAASRERDEADGGEDSSRRLPQPERHVRGLDRVATTARSSSLSASSETSSRRRAPKRLDRLRGVVRAAVEAAVDRAWMRVRAGRNSAATASVEAAIARSEDGLSTNCSSSTLAEVGGRQRGRQRAVDQRALDDDVDVVEPVAQDGERGRDRDADPRSRQRGEPADRPDARCADVDRRDRASVASDRPTTIRLAT